MGSGARSVSETLTEDDVPTGLVVVAHGLATIAQCVPAAMFQLDARAVANRCKSQFDFGVRFGILAGVPASRLYPERPDLANLLLVAVTETTTDEDISALTGALTEVLR